MKIIDESGWHVLRDRHRARVAPWIKDRLERSSRQATHPVEDFLFEYYPYRPGQLQRWHPGLGVGLRGETAREYLPHAGYVERDGVIFADPHTLPSHRIESIRWMRAMLALTQDRTPFHGCFGLHEWAMVYRTEAPRHASWPLRLGSEGTNTVVESLPIRCSHYDAYRFFTPEARPLNKLCPTRATTPAFEQPGCLHTNMDLYKWAFKLCPFVPSELIADTFVLAREIRTLDMRASPYDLQALGFAPVCIETPEGREEYEALQKSFSHQAAPLRQRLIAACDAILGQLSATPTPSPSLSASS